MAHRLIFTNNTKLNRINYISGSGVGAVSASSRAALKRRSNVNATTGLRCCDKVENVEKVYKYFAYVANFNSDNVSAYEIGPTGALTEIVDSPFLAGDDPISVTVDPTGKYAYVANFGSANVSAYTINPTTGVLTFIANYSAGNSPRTVTVYPTGKFAYVATSGSANG